MIASKRPAKLDKYFSGYLPVVIDVETGGFNAETDALLEVAAVFLAFDENQVLVLKKTFAEHVQPFPNAHCDPKALEFTGIIPDHPFRFAKPEEEVLITLFDEIRAEIEMAGCRRAVLVGHNPAFDLQFLNAAVQRCDLEKRCCLHRFTTFDTATLGGVMLGETVLAKACRAAKIPFDPGLAHSAIYDAEATAKLFCYLVNHQHS